MKIYADMFKRWSKIIESYQKKDDPYESSIYFDFVNKYIYFGSDMGKGRMKFFFDIDQSESLPNNFFISITKFLSLIEQYDDINLINSSSDIASVTFSHDDDKFKIATIENEDDRIDTKRFDETNFNYMTVTKNIFSEIENAIMFIDPASSNLNLQNMFITDGYISGYSIELPLYESKIDFEENFVVEVSTASLILRIGNISEGCKLSLNSNTAIVKSLDDEIMVIVPNSFSSIEQNLRDPDFINSYNYSTFVKVDKSLFSNTIQFMKSYMNVSHNGRLFISFDKDMILSLKEDDVFIEKHIPYKELSPEISEKKFAVPGFKLEKSLKVLAGDTLTIKLPVDSKSPLVDLSCDEVRHVIIPRFSE